jgi:hypothetical protein
MRLMRFVLHTPGAMHNQAPHAPYALRAGHGCCLGKTIMSDIASRLWGEARCTQCDQHAGTRWLPQAVVCCEQEHSLPCTRGGNWLSTVRGRGSSPLLPVVVTIGPPCTPLEDSATSPHRNHHATARPFFNPDLSS